MNTLKEILQHTQRSQNVKYNSLVDIMENSEKYNDTLTRKSIGLLKNIKLLIEEYLAEKIRSGEVLSEPKSVTDFIKIKLNGKINEHFIILYLNTKNQFIGYDEHTEGTIDQALVYTRRLIKDALDKNAAGVILAHNHPSGVCTPSREDTILTKKLKEAYKFVDINLLDSIIIGNNDYYSFQENQLI